MTRSNLGGCSPEGISEEIHSGFSKSSFGELITVNRTPIVQLLATNGISEKEIIRTSGTGVIQAADGLFDVSTGTTQYSYATILSGLIPYKGGIGNTARMAAMFDEGVAGCQLLAGFVTSNDGLDFGYSGSDFGIMYRHHGQNEIRTLTVTVASTGAQTVTATIESVAYAVTFTAAATLNETAAHIAVALDASIPNYSVSAIGDVITIMNDVSRPTGGTWSITSTGTITGTFAVVSTGSRPTEVFTNQADWNIDPCPWLDPQKLNVYEIQYQYLGAGSHLYFIGNPNTGRIELVHIHKYNNLNTVPSLSDPNMRIGIVASSLGSTTDLHVYSSSIAGFMDGENVYTHVPHMLTGSNAAVGLTGVNLLSVRNASHKSGKINSILMHITNIDGFSLSAKGTNIDVIKNGTVTGDMVFSDFAANSTIQYSNSALPVTGEAVESIQIGTGSSKEKSNIDITILPGDTLSFVAYLLGTPASYVRVAVQAIEDM